MHSTSRALGPRPPAPPFVKIPRNGFTFPPTMSSPLPFGIVLADESSRDVRGRSEGRHRSLLRRGGVDEPGRGTGSGIASPPHGALLRGDEGCGPPPRRNDRKVHRR